LLAWLCRRAVFTVDLTSAATFHLIAERRPTLICDEAERYVSDKHLRPLLNVGFRKGAEVPRCVGGQVVQFSVYGPKVFCIIGEPPESLLDRSIVVEMRRATSAEKPEELRERTVSQQASALAAKLADWAAANQQNIIECYARTSLGFMPDREANLWAPLFSIAETAIPERVGELQTVALRLVREKAKQDSELAPAVRLLCDLKTVFAEKRTDRIPTDQLIKELQHLPDSPWNRLTSCELARHLRPFEIKSKQLWIDNHNKHGYLLRDCLDTFERYLPATDETTLPNSTGGTDDLAA
jgi:hypothetical protein